MGFGDQKPFEVTQDRIDAPWDGKHVTKGGEWHPHLRCRLCGHKFKLGDIARWVNSKSIVNFFTCEKCDGDDVDERATKHYQESETTHWYLHQAIDDGYDAMNEMCRNCPADREDSF